MFFVRLCWFLFFFVLISTGLSHLFFPFGLEILHKWKWSNIICYLKYVLHFLTNFIWIEITPLKLLPFVRLFVSFQIPNHILSSDCHIVPFSSFLITKGILPWIKRSFRSFWIDVVSIWNIFHLILEFIGGQESPF